MAPQADISSHHFGTNRSVLKSSQTVSAANFSIFQSIATLETYLLTQGFTQPKLDIMTKNDKIMAARQKLGTAVAPNP